SSPSRPPARGFARRARRARAPAGRGLPGARVGERAAGRARRRLRAGMAGQAGALRRDRLDAVRAPRGTRRHGAPRDRRLAARRRRRGLARGVLRQLPVIGRWSVLSEEDRLSPEDDQEARARLLLSRYGVVARELAQGDWSTLRHTLLRMEYGGEIVRGYFVEGLSGEQY